MAAVMLEAVGCVVALGALAAPGAAGAAHAARTPDAVSVSSCERTENEFTGSGDVGQSLHSHRERQSASNF